MFVSVACAVLAGFGLLQAAVGLLSLRRFSHRPDPAVIDWPAVTVLKPLHGDEPLLEDALASICAQDYAEFQLVLGVQDPADPALAVVERLRARFPAVPIDVVVDRTLHGSNRKVSNLVNMLCVAEHEILLIADSDIHSAPDYMRRVVAALQPATGLVTTLYSGLAASNALVGRLGAAFINHNFLPGALLARFVGRQDCLGATMALRRETLERIGGFRAIGNYVADDAALGRLVRAQGLDVVLARTIPATTVAETRLADLLAHELRWMRTMRSVAPAGFPLSVLQYPLFWAALAVAVSGGAAWAWIGFAAAWMARAVISAMLDRTLPVASRLPIWCLPVRDVLSVAVMLLSYRSDRVTWRGREHRVSRFSRTGLQPGEGLVRR